MMRLCVWGNRNYDLGERLNGIQEVGGSNRGTGMSPMHYILMNRINNAVSLLETTDCNVNEISAIVGYENPLYVSRLFKKQKGASPTEYRKPLHDRSAEVHKSNITFEPLASVSARGVFFCVPRQNSF